MFKNKIRISPLSLGNEKITLSTWITIARILLTPLIVATMIGKYWKSAFTLFIIASLSDMLDGKLARYRQEQTLLGACLDPIADKILLLACFFTLAWVPSPLFHLPFWFVLLILIREIIVMSGVIVLYFLKGFTHVQPTMTSKLTTLAQILFIIWLFFCYFFQWLPIKTYYAILAAVTAMVLISLLQYMRIGLRALLSEVS